MQLDFINEIELQDYVAAIKATRAEELALRGLSDVDLADALRDGVKSGRVSQNELTQFLDMSRTFDPNAITPLNVKKGMVPIVNPLTGDVLGYDQSGFNPNADISRAAQPQFTNPDRARTRLAELDGAQTHTIDYEPAVIDDVTGEIVRGERGLRVYDQDGKLLPKGAQVRSTDFETFVEDGETVYRLKSDQTIKNELGVAEGERQLEVEGLLDEVKDRAVLDDSGLVAVDSSWINSIEHVQGATTVQTYSAGGTRLYTYPDASGRQFDAMNAAHESGGSVGRAWWDEVGYTGLKDVFKYGGA